ncbi:KH domain-containing, RNA-binding, signal transduction-associated protein 3 [Microplitis demolitor]|uniref:KH domain-containing, RNA-binding, signal transduction-associated protein 3 n=1 Tax=Microplitis demolitor TaxID=69319 RepID=UPI00235B6094|nr:KH domain-containing, RNA-binding, signal transduction-associated protein 3 [Microplitis demolitor]
MVPYSSCGAGRNAAGGASGSSGSGGVRGGTAGGNCDGVERRMVDITRDKPIKVAVRVQVPVRDHPKFNFVGKLLGPKGNSLKRLQEECGCKMAVLGRGSVKDRQKEEELRASGDPKFSHLSEDLHVEISAFATPAEAHARIAYALVEVRRFLVPDYNDDIRQEQMWEMQMMSTENNNQDLPSSPDDTLSEPAASPVSSTTGNGNGTSNDHESSSKPGVTQTTQGNGMLTGCRKRPLISSGNRPAMSPIKRTVMSLLARARAAQHKELHQQVGMVSNQTPAAIHQSPLNLLAAQTAPTVHTVTQVPQLQLIGSSIPQHSASRRPPILPAPLPQHQMLAPTIHGLIHTQRVAGGPVLPLVREDLIAGVNLV